MSTELIEDQDLVRQDFTTTPLPKGEYARCRFVQCTFIRSDLSRIVFDECSFEECDLSLARINGTAFRNVRFARCKMLGLHFDTANAFLFSILPEHCDLDSCSFRGMRLEKIRFTHCDLRGADLSGTILKGAVLDHCGLRDTVFERTDLQQADLRNARDHVIDPERNNVKHARFSLEGLPGLLAKHALRIEE